ncbi:CGNR zinc finger domain-containing protein [Anaeromyxobacter oryzae]|uniref:Zinc finger CGNR domain-containing protein n=1 Tax=Anaeromyxobacter oryzae TaxID=2918170 RepID=A0ABM7WPU7_9BACT|nr:ABATE domain-containing protein [Anaeromyxobacter oryzae]BDG01491.1 hypothetical protein AMOR_04870 [Anaeromyxobacter oryzae]
MQDRFWLVGNHLAVDFVNTVLGTDLRTEALHDWGDVLRFLVRAGALTEREARRVRRQTRREHAEAAAYAAALSLRDMVRELVTERASGKAPALESISRLNLELEAAATYPQIRETDEGWWLEDLPVNRSWSGALGRIALAAAGLAVRGAGSIRKCANPECILYFRDASQAQVRRWCSMAVCGNRAKVAAHARRATETSIRSRVSTPRGQLAADASTPRILAKP